MANSDKNILITPNTGSATNNPKIEFSGASFSTGPQTITAEILPNSNGTISFTGSAGELFSITNSLTGSIFSVNDISGIPSIEVIDDGTVILAKTAGNVGIGTGTPTAKLHVAGTAKVNTSLTINDYTLPTIDGVVGQAIIANGNGTTSFQDISTTLSIAADGPTASTINLLNDSITISGGSNITTSVDAYGEVNVSLDTDITGLTSLVVDNLTLDGNTISSTNTDGNIILDPNGTGKVGIGTSSPSTTLDVTGDFKIDNVKIDGNTVSSTNTDGNIILDPNGTGKVQISTDTSSYTLPTATGTEGQVLTVDAGGTSTSFQTLDVSTTLNINGDNGTNGAINLLTEPLVVSGGSNITTSIDAYGEVDVSLDTNINVTSITTSGDIEVTSLTSAAGIILKAPSGGRWKITVDDTGNLVTTAVTP